MADKKISQLTAAAALTGVETLPIVQNSNTVKVAVSDLNAGLSTIAVAKGGTGTTTAFTAGSVVFAGASGVYSQNNTNFFWDATNNRLGIRTGAPDVPLQIGGGLSGSNASFPGVLQINEAPNSLQSVGGLEYKTSAFASGYGWKMSSIDSSGVQLVIGTRQNSASWSEVARFTSGANLSLATGNLVIGTAGKGIDFSATASGSGSMSGELLDDYEWGYFTPNIAGSVSAGTGTYVYRIGRYTKVGNRVMFNIMIDWSGHTGTGYLRVIDLPFTSFASAPYYHGVAVGYADAIATTAGTMIHAFVPNNTTQIYIGEIPTGGGTFAYVAMDAAGTLVLSGQYEV